MNEYLPYVLPFGITAIVGVLTRHKIAKAFSYIWEHLVVIKRGDKLRIVLVINSKPKK